MTCFIFLHFLGIGLYHFWAVVGMGIGLGIDMGLRHDKGPFIDIWMGLELKKGCGSTWH